MVLCTMYYHGTIMVLYTTYYIVMVYGTIYYNVLHGTMYALYLQFPVLYSNGRGSHMFPHFQISFINTLDRMKREREREKEKERERENIQTARRHNI